ncbi:MAG: ribosome maturation factor RimM [Woeseiaceae bacterium]|nr:ribosome maturation factor RimM [Woeseiaceae bacterium]
MEEPVLLGRVSGFFGVRGWVKVYSYTDPREAVLDYPHWLIKRGGNWETHTLAEGKRHGKTVIARLEGFDDRDQATSLLDCDIAVRREDLPEPDEGHYYFSDLEGLEVVHQDCKALGRVAYLLETGANDVLVVRDGETERLIPFVAGDVIKDVDLAAGLIRVDWDWD